MRFSLKSIALLMLLAGGSLGVFAATLVADNAPVTAPQDLDRQVDTHVRYYVLEFGLDDEQREALRTVLIQQQRATVDLLRQLHHENRDRFDTIGDRTQSRIREIVGADRYDEAMKKAR